MSCSRFSTARPRVRLSALALAAFSCVAIACAVDDPAAATSIEDDALVGTRVTAGTAQGQLVGQIIGSTAVFKGVRYATARRWQPPAPVPSSTATIDALDVGSRCSQIETGAFGRTTVVGSEDCLFANVWTPAWRWPGERLPVYVFVHGGAYVIGSASEGGFGTQDLYDGRALSERERVIVVTFNYRLGLAGFLSHASQGGDGGAGSYGFLDQIAALAWVHATIAAFGGDPARVTVAGESAGGESVCNLLVSPVAGPLLSGAIMESGPCNAGTRARRDQVGANLARAVGCNAATDPIACMRDKPIDQLMMKLASGGGTVDDADFQMGPVVGGAALPEAPWQAVRAGHQAAVPVMLGSNQSELPAFAVTVDQLIQHAATFGLVLTPDEVDSVVASYRSLHPQLSREAAVAAVATDAVFTCPTKRIADTIGSRAGAPAYRYRFAHGPSLLGIEAPAVHGIELIYVFGSYRGLPGYTIGPVDDAVAGQIQDAFGTFAQTGHPPWWQFWGAADPGAGNAFVFDGWFSSHRADVGTAECALLQPWLDEIYPL